jgi:hypothetical protein
MTSALRAVFAAALVTVSGCASSAGTSAEGPKSQQASPTSVAKTWLGFEAMNKYGAANGLQCDPSPVGLNFQIPRFNGRPASAAYARVLRHCGKRYVVSTSWSTGQIGPTLTVLQTGTHSFVVCGGG